MVKKIKIFVYPLGEKELTSQGSRQQQGNNNSREDNNIRDAINSRDRHQQQEPPETFETTEAVKMSTAVRTAATAEALSPGGTPGTSTAGRTTTVPGNTSNSSVASNLAYQEASTMLSFFKKSND